MLKKSLAVLLVLVMVTSFASFTAFAEGKTYEAIKGTPVIDGVMDDIWQKATEADMPNIVLEGTEDAPFGDVKWRAMWDEEHLYIWAEVEDVEMFGDNPDNYMHLEDTIFTYIEESNDKDGKYTDGVDKIAKINATGKTDVSTDEDQTHWDAKAVMTEGEGYVVEAAATFVSITGEVDKTIGFDISICDAEYFEGLEIWERSGLALWNDMTDHVWENTSLMGNLKMVEAPADEEVIDTDSGSNDEETAGTDEEGSELPDTGVEVTLLYAAAIIMIAAGLATVIRKTVDSRN